MRVRALLLATLVSIAAVAPAIAEEGIEWPVEMDTKKGKVVLYQPQLDTFEGNSFTARAAVSVTPEDKEPVFGVAWFKATCETDRREREVHLEKVEVPRVRFPDATPEQEKQLSEFLAKEMSSWDITLSLDALLATLEEAEKKSEASENLGTAPPKILFVDHNAMLVTFDGEPKLAPIPDSKMQYVVNSPQPIVFDPESKVYYLSADEHFIAAKDPLGEWKPAKRVPKEVEKLAERREEAAPKDAEKKEDEDVPPPEVIVAQQPTELIVTDGKPEFAPISGSELLYMTNTDSDVFLEVATGLHYMPLAGRWYRSKPLEGPWEHVDGDSLPAAFAQIPPDSDKGHVLAFVPGTDAAIEAALDAQVPQTAAVKRSGTTPDVKYDGEPEFKDIEGTPMAYAVNTSSAVLRIEGKFWCCDDAVWFVAADPKGPWQVSDVRPDAVDDLPPDNPHYNVKYVYVYDSTPEVVYVGYTPGYTGCYVYGGCVVYGTGYPYPGWWGPYYYPHPVTYGVHISYNPWSGWGFGFSCHASHFSFHYHSGGFYGPPHYRPPYYRPPGYRPPGYRPPGYRPPAYRPPGGGRPGDRPRPTQQPSGGNVYDRRAQSGQAQVRDRSTRPATSDARTPKVSPGRNDVYADRNGDVYRKDQGGDWQKREQNQWKSSQQPSRQQSSQRLERDAQARQRSADRSRSMSSGRPRGGGGRRR